MNIFVTNLPKHFDEEDLEMLFDRCGTVEDVDIWVYDDGEKDSPRFAIVQMPDDHDAKKAIKKLDGRTLRRSRRRLWVEEAPEVFGRLRAICRDASSNESYYWGPRKYRPHRVSSS
jgi:RNA recognition motif-containing protein